MFGGALSPPPVAMRLEWDLVQCSLSVERTLDSAKGQLSNSLLALGDKL